MSTEGDLCNLECAPCKGGVDPLAGQALAKFVEQLGGDWSVVEGHHLQKEFSFADFVQALAFTNTVGGIAESMGHHPDLHLAWGKLRVEIWTHSIDGLADADFVLAARVDRAFKAR